MPGKIKILITSFEPFEGRTVNISQEVGALLACPENAALIKYTLPTDFTKADQLLRAKIAKEKPDYILCLGESFGSYYGLRIERVASNCTDYQKNSNPTLKPESIINAHAGLTEALKLAGAKYLPPPCEGATENDRTAGGSICEHTFYVALQAMQAMDKQGQVCFLHLGGTKPQYEYHGGLYRGLAPARHTSIQTPQQLYQAYAKTIDAALHYIAHNALDLKKNTYTHCDEVAPTRQASLVGDYQLVPNDASSYYVPMDSATPVHHGLDSLPKPANKVLPPRR